MYRTFLNDIFSDDNEDIKVRLDTTPRTDNYNKIAASNTPDYAAGLGALSNYYDNKNNALQTQLDFAKNNYNQSNRKVLLDAILAHERGLQNDRFAHEKTMKENKYNYLNNKRTAEHKHLMDMLIEKNKGNLATTEAQYKPNVMEQDRLYKEFEANQKRQALLDKNAHDKALLDAGIDPRTLQPLNKTNTVSHGGITLKKPTENVNVQNNAVNMTPINAQNDTNNVNTINNNSGMSGDVNAALIKHDLEQEQKAKKNKNFNIQNTMKKQYGDHYTAGMNINRWGFGDTKNKMPEPIEKSYNVDRLQHYYQRKGSRFTPDNSSSFADPKNRLNDSNKDLLKIENAHKFMDLHKAGFLPNSWEDVDADVKTGLLNNNINFEEYEPIVGPKGEFYLFNYDTGNVYGFDSINGLELISMPEEQSFVDYIGEDIGNFLSKRSLDNLANITPTKYIAEGITTGMLNSQDAYEIAQNISNDMDKAGGDYIRNHPWLSKPIDYVLDWFK